jgi:hypothetical protein
LISLEAGYIMKSKPADVLWMGLALGTSLVLAVVMLAALGVGERGTDVALQATARLSFLLFWAAYAGGALTTLFGSAFGYLKLRAREFGLAFAAAHIVHICLVAWLCWIGAAPAYSTFVFFGIALIWIYLLAFLSFGTLQQALGRKWWWILRTVGMNYIAYAFFVDFTRNPLGHNLKQAVEYWPCALLSVIGPILRLAAWIRRISDSRPVLDQSAHQQHSL